MPSRWDHLLETKPIPVSEHVLNEVAKLLAKDLETWPPPVEELDPLTGGQFAGMLEPGRPKPQAVAYHEALKLARWELSREVDAYDDYMRNRRWLERGLAPDDKRVLLFLSRWMVEQMLGLGEATSGRIKRPQMVECLNRLEREWVQRQRLIHPPS
jgi:hypothetical protein